MSDGRNQLGEDDPRHGTENAYNNLGCRCVRCREAHRRHYVEKRASAAATRTCPNCGGPGGMRADGTCHACDEYQRRAGRPRTTSRMRKLELEVERLVEERERLVEQVERMRSERDEARERLARMDPEFVIATIKDVLRKEREGER